MMRSKLNPSFSSSSSKVTGLCREMSMPTSAMAATAKASSSPLRTPAEPTYVVRPNIWVNRPAAIGERTEFMPQANSTARGRVTAAAIGLSALPVQHRDQGEQPPRGVEVDLDLALEPLHHDARALVVQPPAAHIERFDAIRRRGADRGVIAVADGEVVLDDLAERHQRQHVGDHRRAVGQADVEHQAVAAQAEMQRVGAAVVADGTEFVV